MQDLDIGILTAKDFSLKTDGEYCLKLLCNLLPNFMPHKYGKNEEDTYLFNLEEIEKNLDSWGVSHLFWKSRRAVAEGSIWMRDRTHGAIYISGKSKAVNLQNAVQFLVDQSTYLNADFAYIHLYTEEEFNTGVYEMIMPFRQGIVTHELRKNLPQLSWGTVFGMPYINLFGREHLLKSPAYLVRELSDKMIYVQLTESLSDLTTDYTMVELIRYKVKQHLNNNAFFNPTFERNHKYSTPIFELS